MRAVTLNLPQPFAGMRFHMDGQPRLNDTAMDRAEFSS